MKAPVSVIIPTLNEQRNISRSLGSVSEWADEVFVLDSYSDDRTVEIAGEMGAQVTQRRFDNFSAHKNWALDNLPLRNEWVFFLDADERVTRELMKRSVGCCSARIAATVTMSRERTTSWAGGSGMLGCILIGSFVCFAAG